MKIKMMSALTLLSSGGLSVVSADVTTEKVGPGESKVTKKTEKIPFKIKRVEDETLKEGVEKVVTKGVDGEREITTTINTTIYKDKDVSSKNVRKRQNIIIFTEYSSAMGMHFLDNYGKFHHEDFKALWDNMIPGDRLIWITDDNLPETFKGKVHMIEKGKNNLEDMNNSLHAAASATTGIDIFRKLGLSDEEVKNSDIRFNMDDLTTSPDIMNKNTGLKEFILAGKLLSVNLETYPQDGSASFKSLRYTAQALNNAGIKFVSNKPGVINDPEIKVNETHKIVKETTRTVDEVPVVTEKITKEPVDEVIHVGVLGSKEEKETVETPYDTRYEDDNTMLEGIRKTKQTGVQGSKELTKVWKTIKGEKRGNPTVTEKVLRQPVDEIIQIGTLGYKFMRESNIIDSNYKFDYHDGTNYGKVTGTTLGHHGLGETTKKYKTIKGIVTGDPEVTTKTVVEKQDTNKLLGTHGKNVYTETVIEPKVVTYVNDPTLEEGKEVTAISGQDGLKERVSAWETYKGYRRGEAKVIENVIKEKVDMVIRRGTKKKEVLQAKKDVVQPKVNEINKGVEKGLVSDNAKALVAPKVEVPKPEVKEEAKRVVQKPMFAFDSFFKEINETSDLISRLVTRNVNEEKRVSDMVETEKKVTTSNELLDLIKLFIKG